MVSVGPLVVAADGRLALALWPTSTCAANLARTGRATLAVVADGLAFSLRCHVDDELPITAGEDSAMRGFVLRVVAAMEDSAPYADLLTGSRVACMTPGDPGSWRRTRAALAAVLAGQGPGVGRVP